MSGSAPNSWSVGDLGAFYAKNRAEIHAHALRLIKDPFRADEIVQDVFLKFVLAAPEIDSEEWALAYLHRSIENQVKDIFRAEGRRPNLVLIDDAQAEVEAKWQVTDPDIADQMEAADDAAIIRQALALLPAAQRQALVMWEIEEKTTQEIAAELGIEEKNVRHAVSRARSNFRRVLSEWVVDEERGLTALDLLSSSYVRAAAGVKKASRAVLSLMILVSAFIGFNSLTSSDVVPSAVVASDVVAPSKPVVKSQVVPVALPSKSAAPIVEASVPGSSVAGVDFVQVLTVRQAQIDAALAKLSVGAWPGLDASGLPQGFTVNDGAAFSGTAVINQDFPVLTLAGTVVSESELMTSADVTNVLLHQKVVYNGSDLAYDVNPSVRMNGTWISLTVASRSTTISTLADGSRLITSYLLIDPSTPLAGVSAPGFGVDAAHIPATITVRLHTSTTGQPIYGQAVQILDPLKAGA